MGTSDFRVACGFQHHPKVRQLRRRLGDGAAFSLVCLWGFAAQQGRDGLLPNNTDFIASASDWSGDAQEFVNVLVECHLLDRKRRALKIHNWSARNPFAASFEMRSAQAKEANKIRWERVNRERMRKASEPESGPDTVQSEPGPNRNPPSPSPTLSPKKVRSKRSDDSEPEGFQKFYGSYPRHDARKKALEAWLSVNPNDELESRIIADVERRKTTDWRDTPRKFIPLPSTYLNGARWTDEIGTPPNNNGATPFRELLKEARS
jgi:hypothetical protein